ncbi:MAG: Blue-light-activated protein [Syntrophorhabdus sp. PtaU1.Bin058]|nr:MAG: Blue-light-activated protein [Syntrophorhabdus sp. PtaU1.Bin058]
MKDPFRTNQELLEEISVLKQRIKELEEYEARRSKDKEGLWRSDNPFHIFFDLAPDPMAITNFDDGRIIDVNQAFVAHSHYSRDELIGRTATEVGIWVNEEDRDAILKHLCDTGYVENIEVPFKRRNGEIRQAVFSGRPIEIGNQKWLLSVSRDITEHKQTERTLQESEERFRSLVETTSDWVWEIDRNSRYTYSSQKVRDFLGYEPEEIIGKTPFDFMSPQEVKRTIPLFKDIAKSRKSFSRLENTNLHKDGRTVVLETSGVPVFDEKGNFSGYKGIDRDITGRKEMEEALLKSEEKYRGIFENAVMGIFQTTPEGRYVSVNPAGARMYGYESPEEMMQSVADMARQVYVHPEDRQRLKDLIESDGFVEDFEAEHYTKNGGRMWASVNARAIRDASGAMLYETTSQNITERKQAEIRLLESEERYRTVFENTGAATVIIESDTTISLCNAEFERLSGYTKDEIEGKKSWTEFTDTKDWERMLAWHYLRRQDPNKAAKRYEFRFVTRSGGVRHIYLVMDIVPGTEKSVASLIDITDYKRAEEEKAQLESRLFQAQKMEAIGTLAGGIAHDFNNILTALTGYASLLQMKIDNGVLRTYTDQILFASRKAVDLIQSLLAFSRQQAVTLNPVNINNVIRNTKKLLKRLLTEDIKLRILIAPDDIIIMADVTQIDQILFNLITNAKDAMPHGGTLTIETRPVELDSEFRRSHGYGEPGNYALLSVSDTGLGMSETIREKIFDPFFTTKAIGKGTGLGLSTVYGIVKQHNGYITVHSKPNTGTTFHIYLPAVSNVGREYEPAPVPVSSRGNETILVAEDNETVRGFIKEILTEYGYTVIEAVDGADAIEQFNKTERIDLLILDSVMPEKNGREVYDEISRDRPDIQVLFTSGYTKDVILDKGIEGKQFDFIAKPILPDTFLQKIREILDRRLFD